MSSLCLCLFLSSLTVVSVAGELEADTNPFSPKASLIRYWNNHITNDDPKPDFLLSKASPLDVVDAAAFSKLAARNALSDHLKSFCSAANLLCFSDLAPGLDKHDKDSDFSTYANRNFSNYGNARLGGADVFKKYSEGQNLPVDSFNRYSRNSAGHKDKFDVYVPEGNVVDQSFDGYGVGATGGTGDFTNYNKEVNVPNLIFGNYGTEGNGRGHNFAVYTENTNSGKEKFSSYGRNENGAVNEFKSYAKDSNVIGSDFSGYSEKGNGINDTFTHYGDTGNVPENNFKGYGDGGNGITESFDSYRDQANVGDDRFESYAKNSNNAAVDFANYGKSFNEGTDTFSLYGQGAHGQSIGFSIYGVNNSFTDYAKKSQTSFAKYTSRSEARVVAAELAKSNGGRTNRWIEPGKFFRESMLKKGMIMPMPDIRDKMPKRSFLPRTIITKLPFSSSSLADMKKTFHAADNSSMESMMVAALRDCERAPSHGETKQCVGSIEDMIEFSTSVLGRNVVVRTTDSVAGSGKHILIGQVTGINDGKVTESVSCHQTLYPYLLYYCHSVPKVRVYQADILDPDSKAKINHGVAICHIDTSAWSPTHGAFIALGYGPGKIEVCHWIFENDMTWARAD